ncbi:hypothetical protein HRbin15_02392 [bacterium HR15]|nr:hypothetical protein HRbin15_02392 [bacterium HR15]
MNAFQIAVLVYALIIAAGGIMGYVSAKSTASLISGLISGVLLLVAFALSLRNPKVGFALAALIALGLGIFFLVRFLHTGKWMPAGISVVLSAVMLALMLWGLFRPEAR